MSNLVTTVKIIAIISGLVLILDYFGIEVLPLFTIWHFYAIVFLYLFWRLVRAVEKSKI